MFGESVGKLAPKQSEPFQPIEFRDDLIEGVVQVRAVASKTRTYLEGG
jgi:hypothetical protein